MSINNPSNDQPTLVAPRPDHKKRNILLGAGGALVALVGCLCLLAAGVIFVDPFGLHLVDRLTGRYDPVASALPADTNVYVGFNLLKARDSKTGAIIKAFGDASGQAEVTDTQSMMDELDKSLSQDLGMTFKDDILPWIGQYAGVGVTSFQIYDGAPQDLQLVFAIEARDRKKADEFLAKLQQTMQDKGDVSFHQVTYKNVTISESESSYGSTQLAMARSGSMVLFAPNVGGIQEAIDAQGGASLYNSSGFSKILSQLPSGRLLTVYYNSQTLRELASSLGQDSLGSATTGLENLGMREGAAALTVVDAGLQLDSLAAYNLDEMTAEQKQMLQAGGGAAKAAGNLPEDTFLFIAGNHLDLSWKAIEATLTKTLGEQDYREAMDNFEKQYGLNPGQDFFPYLDGDWALGIMTSQEGLLAESANVGMGVNLLVGTSQPDALLTSLRNLNSQIQEMGMSVEEAGTSDLAIFNLQDPSSGNTTLSYGVASGYLALSSSQTDLKALFSPASPLSKNKSYQQVWKAFPSGMTPNLYMDMTAALDTVQQSLSASGSTEYDQVIASLYPITTIAVASSPFKGDTAKSTLIIFIPTK